ncbi:hypothetical protein, partial [Caldivirga sp.]|uniref:hypothetical protein n=1 Tax=Caldivirga sp. TaxID=2080243 RepID=UPI003D0D1224
MLSKHWIVIALVVVLVLFSVFLFFNVSCNDCLVLVEAELPNSFTVTGPYAKLLYVMLNLPFNSTLSPIMLTSRPSVRIAWHVDYLTLILRNGGRIIIEARTQEIQIKANGVWLTITPNNIKPKYKIKIIKNNETLKALMSIAGELSQSLLRNPPLVVRPPVHGASTLLDPSNPTWALSAFANVNSSNVVCGYAYPDNGSDLIIPSSDFA